MPVHCKPEFPPTRQNRSFCSHFCMYFSHFRTSESIDVQSSAMQTHLHSKLLVIWIYLEGYLIIIIIVSSNIHHQDSSEASCSHVLTVMTMIVFCTCRYNCSQCTNHGCKLLRTTFQMCLIYWTHHHSIAVVVFDSNDLSWLSLEIPLHSTGRVT